MTITLTKPEVEVENDHDEELEHLFQHRDDPRAMCGEEIVDLQLCEDPNCTHPVCPDCAFLDEISPLCTCPRCGPRFRGQSPRGVWFDEMPVLG